MLCVICMWPMYTLCSHRARMFSSRYWLTGLKEDPPSMMANWSWWSVPFPYYWLCWVLQPLHTCRYIDAAFSVMAVVLVRHWTRQGSTETVSSSVANTLFSWTTWSTPPSSTECWGRCCYCDQCMPSCPVLVAMRTSQRSITQWWVLHTVEAALSFS